MGWMMKKLTQDKVTGKISAVDASYEEKEVMDSIDKKSYNYKKYEVTPKNPYVDRDEEKYEQWNREDRYKYPIKEVEKEISEYPDDYPNDVPAVEPIPRKKKQQKTEEQEFKEFEDAIEKAKTETPLNKKIKEIRAEIDKIAAIIAKSTNPENIKKMETYIAGMKKVLEILEAK